MSKMLQALIQEGPHWLRYHRARQTAVKVLCRRRVESVWHSLTCQDNHLYSLLQVRKVHFDTQDHGPQTITGLEPKEAPPLHQHQGKGSVEWENSHYVSGCLLGLEWEGLGVTPASSA